MSGPAWRWKVAAAVDRLPGQCWSDLVSWALKSDTDETLMSRLPWRPQGAACRIDTQRNGFCYCGKVRDMSRPDVAAVFASKDES